MTRTRKSSDGATLEADLEEITLTADEAAGAAERVFDLKRNPSLMRRGEKLYEKERTGMVV